MEIIFNSYEKLSYWMFEFKNVTLWTRFGQEAIVSIFSINKNAMKSKIYKFIVNPNICAMF